MEEVCKSVTSSVHHRFKLCLQDFRFSHFRCITSFVALVRQILNLTRSFCIYIYIVEKYAHSQFGQVF